MKTRIVVLALLAVGSGLMTKRVCAQASVATIEKAVVIVIARGVDTGLGNRPAAAQGTGFFIHRDGYLVTSYHLRKVLGDVDERTVGFEVHFGPNDADVFRAGQVFANPEADIMVLYASVGNHPYDILRRGSRDGIELGTTPIYTGGYPEGYQFSVDSGVLKSLGTIDPIPVWSTSLTFKAGQSGSPIVLNDLRVIGFAKGNDADATSIGLIVPASAIPSNFWDGTTNLSAESASRLVSNESQPAPVVYTQLALADKSPAKRQVTFKLQNEPCEDSGSRDYRVEATKGWVIDPASISVERLSSTGESNRFVVTDRAESGFKVSAELANIGKCVRAFGHTIVAGVPAEFTGVASYVERPVSGERLVTVSAASPLGNVQSPLPDVARDRYKFSIRKADGTLVDFTPTDDELKKKQGALILNNKKVAERVLNEKF